MRSKRSMRKRRKTREIPFANLRPFTLHVGKYSNRGSVAMASQDNGYFQLSSIFLVSSDRGAKEDTDVSEKKDNE